jgi:hypothetical protein
VLRIVSKGFDEATMGKLLETPSELAKRVGIPVSNVRFLIREDMLEHIYTAPGRRNPKIPQGAWERYVERFTVKAVECSRSDAASGANRGREQR